MPGRQHWRGGLVRPSPVLSFGSTGGERQHGTAQSHNHAKFKPHRPLTADIHFGNKGAIGAAQVLEAPCITVKPNQCMAS